MYVTYIYILYLRCKDWDAMAASLEHLGLIALGLLSIKLLSGLQAILTAC